MALQYFSKIFLNKHVLITKCFLPKQNYAFFQKVLRHTYNLNLNKFIPFFNNLKLTNYATISKMQETELVAADDENKEAIPDPNLRPIIDLVTSKRYLSSQAYKITYGNALVWQPYRRNHKGLIPPEKTRKSCIKKGVIRTGNPCPICRDEYLVLHPENVELLKQFISPYTGEVLSYKVTNLCQTQQKKLLVAIQQAWDYGYIEMPLPFREYNYKEYYPKLNTSLVK